MEQEKELSGHESLELITQMINKAKSDYFDTGLSALLWGSVVTFCSLVTFVNYWVGWPALNFVWLLTVAAVAPQIVISIRERRTRKYKSYEEDLMSGIWISFGITMFIVSYVLSTHPFGQEAAIYLTIYGIPTFSIGFGRRFRPMLLGGLACWLMAILSVFTPFPYVMLYMATAGQLAWFIPGLILRKCYLKAKAQHV
jgi:hypothetical protein